MLDIALVGLQIGLAMLQAALAVCHVAKLLTT